MTNLYALLKAQESIIDDPLSTAVRWVVGERIQALNESAIQMNRDLKIILEKASDSTVANQASYSLPRDQDSQPPITEDIYAIVFEPGDTHRKLTNLNIRDYLGLIPQYADPSFYTVIPREDSIRFYPTPDTAAQTTTTTATATATATSITVASTTGFSDSGAIKNTTTGEVMRYDAKTTTTLTQLTRGVEGTSGIAVGNGDTITWRNLEYWIIKKPERMIRMYNTGTIAATNDSVTVTGTTTNWTNTVKAGDWLGSGAHTAAYPERYYKIDTVATSVGITLVEKWQEATITGAAYGVGQESPFPEGYDKGLVLLSCAMLFRKDDDPKRLELLKQYELFKHERTSDALYADYTPIMGRRQSPIRTFGGTLPAYYP